MMRWLETLFRAVSPAIDLEGTPWESEWKESQRDLFAKVMKISLPLIGLAYIFHYFFFDKPEGLEPIEGWFHYRMGAAALMLLVCAYYFSPLTRWTWYKLPGIVATGFVGFSQAHVTLNYPPAPWIYPFVFVISSVLILRLDAFKSLLFTLASTTLIVPVLVEAGVQFETLISAAIVSCIIAVMVRSSFSFEVNNFLLQKRNEHQQELNLQLQEDFSHRIRSFIPNVISTRIENHVENDNVSVTEASISVLKPSAKQVACLFSDIRGFTQASKDLEKFVHESVIPEVKAVSAQIEANEGIPRKIGDLIFAYYDDEHIELNVVRAVLSGIQLSLKNKAINATVSAIEIKRYILISAGEAVVGNLGGIDSSVEITALGSPVNFLSRLDDATKSPALASLLSPGDLVMSSHAAKILGDVVSIDFQKVDLAELEVSIRDFPETEYIYILQPSAELALKLTTFCKQHDIESAMNKRANG